MLPFWILFTCIKLTPVFKAFIMSIFEWPLKTGLTVCNCGNSQKNFCSQTESHFSYYSLWKIYHPRPPHHSEVNWSVIQFWWNWETKRIITPHVTFPCKNSIGRGLKILIIIPHIKFPCKTSIGRLLSPCDNFYYHMRSIYARTVRFCKTFDFKDDPIKPRI